MTQMGTVNGADALLELFRTQGADYIFCSPIAAWAPLWESLAKRQATTNIETPKYLNCRHEILAVGLASGYYKATGRTQAVLLPTGLGVLHGALAVRSAFGLAWSPASPPIKRANARGRSIYLGRLESRFTWN